MGILILAAIGMLIYVLQHCRRQKTEYIDEIVYKILKICQALQFVHEGKPLGMGAGCLNIQSKQITVAFPIKEAWIDSIILRPVLWGLRLAVNGRRPYDVFLRSCKMGFRRRNTSILWRKGLNSQAEYFQAQLLC